MIEPGELYFDHNATSPLLPEVAAALSEFVSSPRANPASSHRAGERSRRQLELAREQVASMIGADPRALVFTSGATEANHLALFGALAPAFSRTHVVVSAIEHRSLLDAAKFLEELGARVTRVAPQADGSVAAKELLAAIEPTTKLVALMAANNETGVEQPVGEVAAALAARRVRFHVDAVQTAGWRTLDVRTLPATTLALSAHKIGGPMGVGALFVRPEHPLAPFVRGGTQERGRRGGTHNLLGIVGFGVAAGLLFARRRAADEVAKRRDSFETELERAVAGSVVVGRTAPRIPNTSSITFADIDASRLLALLSRRGLHASAGSACQSGAAEPSHVLRAMGLSAAAARATVRFSLGPATTSGELTRAVEIVRTAVAELRASPISGS